MKKKLNRASRFLKEKRMGRAEKYREYAMRNMLEMTVLLEKNYPEPDKMFRHIETFLNNALCGQAGNLDIPDGFDPGLLSLLFSNMALWLGNMQQVHKNSDIEK